MHDISYTLTKRYKEVLLCQVTDKCYVSQRYVSQRYVSQCYVSQRYVSQAVRPIPVIDFIFSTQR